MSAESTRFDPADFAFATAGRGRRSLRRSSRRRAGSGGGCGSSAARCRPRTRRTRPSARRVGLAVFASDALSSTAYATQEILIVLAVAGAAALRLRVPDLGRHRGPAGHRHDLVRADHPRLSGRRRRLHRRPRQPRRAAGADRGRGAPHRLHPDRGRVGVVGRGAARVRLPALFAHRVALAVSWCS